MGDPVEVEAAAQVYQRGTHRTQYCALGAVKANIGHTASAAGVLSVIKACLALEHGIIPPNIHCDRPNPRLDLPATPFYLPRESAEWNPDGHPRRAAVSAFGFGGNNAHAVLEAPPIRPDRTGQGRPAVVVLSARTPLARERQIERLADHLGTHPQLDVADVAHTLQAGRKEFDCRAAVVMPGDAAARDRLLDRPIHRGQAREGRPVIFALPGQGSQRAGMGRALYEEDSHYRRDVDQCAGLLASDLDVDIRSLLHANDAAAIKTIGQTALAQPALFVVEYALARRLMARGVEPAAIIGHSLGELVAACLAGVFSLPDALALVALRGRLMQACAPGAMMAVFRSAAELEARLERDVAVAALNAPEFTVVSGPVDAVERFRVRLEEEGVTCRVVQTSHGFHSQSMEPALQPFREAVAQVERAVPRLPFVSSVTGRLITDVDATDPGYWAHQIRQPVRFSQGVETLSSLAGAVWVEVGPGSALSSLIRKQTDGATVVSALDGDRHAGFLDVLSRLWVEGVPVDLSGREPDNGRRMVALPTYPFEPGNYWIDPPVFRPDRDNGDVPPAETEAPQEEQEWLHVAAWRKSPLRAPVRSADEGWLIFEDFSGLGARMAKSLREAGARVLSLLPGTQFEQSDGDTFRVRPGVVDDLAAVLTRGASSGWKPQRVVHLWQADGGGDDAANPCQTLDACLDLGFHTLTALVRALYAHGVDEEVLVTVAADGVVALDGEGGEIRWEKASLLGPCRVAPLEMPPLSCQVIDLPAAGPPATWLADGLLAEASTPEPGPLKALREGGRYIETFRPLPELFGGGGLRSGGVVLITGGMGGLGLEVAGRLFEMVQMRLALLTRWAPPPVEDWPERAKADDRIGQALAKALALQARGAEVFLVHGDAAVADDMARVVEQVRGRFGAIHGVVHAAGAALPALILESSRERVERVFAPKVKGALILEELLGDESLDFFVSFSSIASVAPTVGQVDYAAANAVLDALARRRVGSSWARVCSISWDAWQDVGMAAGALRGENLGMRLFRNDGSDDPGDWRLVGREVGNPSALELVPLDLPSPATGEVQVEVYAAGFNPRDALTSSGDLSDADTQDWLVGAECSGRIVAVGSGVEGLSVGDPVIAVGEGALATRVNADARLVARKPEVLSFEEAAGIAVAFLTAKYALTHLARLARAERVLIHAAPEGVGLAAIQVARVAGAEVYVTAGSDEERTYLSDLGVRPVMHPRTPGFLRSVRTETGGHGVDVVLDALGGELIPDGLDLLRPFGRFLGIGSQDIRWNTASGLLPFRNNLSLHAVDLGPMIRARHPALVRMLGELVEAVRQGQLKPAPIHAAPWEDAQQATEHRAVQRIGNAVLVMRRSSERPRGRLTEEEASRLGYRWSIPLQRGLDIFQELLQGANVPPHVVASVRPLMSEADLDARPTLQDEGAPEAKRVSSADYRTASGPTEAQVVEIWEQVLAVESIGMDDDFLELGGDSISSMQILSRIPEGAGGALTSRHDLAMSYSGSTE